ncbi:MAG: ATP synthase F1 subunit delta [Coriobacteriia bacterium]|nr:ATP synthase F1 subunit delta [Coriobacteriia bacterium]
MSDRAAETYARSLFDLASASDAVDAVDEGLRAVAAAIRGHAGMREALADPGVPVEKKRAILRDAFGEAVAPETLSLVTLIVERGRVDLLGEVAARYAEIAEEERGIVAAEVTTAIELTDSARARVVEKLTSALGRPVTLRERVEPAMLGGIRIKVAGRVLDGSLSSQLASMRAALSTAGAGGEA